MKRIRVIVLTAFSALLPLLGLNATPTFTINGGTLTAVELHGDTEVVIPYGVTSIGDNVFMRLTSLRRVFIPNGVTSIGHNAFYGCTSLSEVNIPDGVTTIGDWAFKDCRSLMSVSIPSSVTRIGGNAFSGCGFAWMIISNGELTGVELNGATDVSIPYGVTRIRNDAFRYCNGLKSVTIGGSVEEIESGAFQGCYALESVTIGGAIVTIGNDAFANCNNLESVTVSSSADSWRTPRIGIHAFEGCNSLKSLTIGGNIAEIGDGAFQGCYALESLTLSATITKIEQRAFASCDRMKSVTIGGSPASGGEPLRIGDGAFDFCRELESVTIGGNVAEIGDSAFLSCGKLENVTVGGYVRTIGPQAFGECLKLKSVTVGGGVEHIGFDAFAACIELANLSLGDSLRSIDSRAFRSCRSLPEIMIPASTTYIAGDAFLYCTGLETISVAEDNPAYMAQNGFLLSKDGGTLVASANDNIADMPERVTEIGASVFAGRTDLTSATIPDSVTRIGVSAFSGCSNLTNVVIPASVTYIGEKAFFGCNGLADEDGFVIVRSVLYDYFGDSGDITIADSVTKIGANAFDNCGSLTNVTISESVTSIGESAFAGCGKLALALLPMQLSESVSKNNQFKNCASNFKMVFYEGSLDEVAWVAVGFDANGGSVGTASMDILKGQALKTIGNLPTPSRTYYRFLGWYTDATGGEPATGDMIVNGNVTLYAHWKAPDTIPTIEGAILKVLDGVLLHADFCTSDVTIPESVTSIGDSAFYGQQELTSVIIPDSVTSIGTRAFYNCVNLASVAIGKGVTNIGSYAFSGCSRVTNVIVPQYVCDVAMGSVFPGANASITNLVIADGVTGIARYAFWNYYGVSSITIPNSVTNIDRYAFPYCDNLSLALVPSRLKDIVSQNNPFLYSNPEIVYYDDADWVDVTFDANGGYVAPSVANALKGHVSGYGIGNFPSALRPGYDFKGWFTDAEGGEQVTVQTIVEGDLTVYAHWEKQPVFLWVYAMIDWGSRNAVDIINGVTASSSMVFLVPQNAEGLFITNIVFQVKDGYELDTVTTNGAMVAEASGKKGVWTLNIDLPDSGSRTFDVRASARLENYGVVAEKATCERTIGGYTLTAKDGETLFEGDIALTAVLDGAIVDTTKGYDVGIAADGKSATARLKTPTFGAAAIVAGDNSPEADSSDPTGTLVESDGVALSTLPWANDDEQIGALPVAAVPGLYYKAAWGDDLDDLTVGAKVQATTDTLYLGVIKQTGTSGFYKVTVSER